MSVQATATDKPTDKPTCDAPDCEAPRTGAKLYCIKHQTRLNRHGTLEALKTGPKTTGATSATCSRCNLAFKATPRQRQKAAEGRDVFCSRDCQKGANLVNLECGHCGVAVTRRKADVKGKRVFCSAECRNEFGNKPRTGRTIPCETCGVDVYVKKSEEGIKRFCSPECRNKAQERREDRECGNCQEPFTVRSSSEAHYCSRDCFHEARRKKIGDRYVDPNTGYAWVWIDGGDGQPIKVQEHRHVMAQHIGRPLYTWETVHHRHDGDDPEQKWNGRSNNNIENLELWPSRHPRGHRVEDVVTYCRQMLSLYGDQAEQKKYAPLVVTIENTKADDAT